MNIVNEILIEGVSITFGTVWIIIVKVIISLVTVMNFSQCLSDILIFKDMVKKWYGHGH